MVSLRNKISQMLIIGFEGTTVDEQRPIAQWLAKDQLGGVILFDKDCATGLYGKNLKTEQQIKQLINTLHSYAKAPLLIAVDYEGGAVDRLASIEGMKPTKSAITLAAMSHDALENEFTEMALCLKSLGFNLNFAPVVDLNLNESQGIIGKLGRSFSNKPELVSRIASAFVDVFARHQIGCCYKHFPGHGSAIGDTHEGFVDVTNTFVHEELAPYYQLLKDKDHPLMIMTAHVVNRHLDSDGLPATLSYKVLTNLLRNEIGFDGVIISDDLQMNAIASHFSLEEALRLTINAGSDMVIIGNQLGFVSAPTVIDCIEHLVLTQQIQPSRIDEAYQRICTYKKQLANTKQSVVS